MKKARFIIWKFGKNLYRITTSDIRKEVRELETACISDIDILFETMEEIKCTLKDYEISFDTLDASRF